MKSALNLIGSESCQISQRQYAQEYVEGLETQQRLDAAEKLLSEIYDSTGDKEEGVCPVCGIYTHKHWCWYPRLLQRLLKKLDVHDRKFLGITISEYDDD